MSSLSVVGTPPSPPSFLYHQTQAPLLGYNNPGVTVVSGRSASGGRTWGGSGFTFPTKEDVNKKLLCSPTKSNIITHMVVVPNEEAVAYVSDTDKYFYILPLSDTMDIKRKYRFSPSKTILGRGTKICFSPTGNKAAILNIYRIFVYDFSTLKVVQKLKLDIDSDGYLQTMAFSADGKRLVAVSRRVLSSEIKSKITVWETEDDEDDEASTKNIKTKDISAAGTDSHLGIQGITFLQDSQKVLYVENMENKISRACIWDTETKVVTSKYSYVIGTPTVMAASRDCTKVAIGYHNGSLCVFNASNWEVLKRKADAHKNKVTALSFSGNGNYIVSGGSDKTIRFWDFNKAGDPPLGIVGVAGGELVTVGISNNQTKIWGLDTNGHAFMWTINKKEQKEIESSTKTAQGAKRKRLLKNPPFYATSSKGGSKFSTKSTKAGRLRKKRQKKAP